MTNMSKTIVFFGTDNFSLIALESLIKAGYDVAAVVTKPDSKSGRGQSLKAPSVKMLAEKNNIAVWQPDNVLDINQKIINLNRKVTGVLVSYGRIVPKSTIDLFDPGIINVHPSLLPVYRGSTPIESAIINNNAITGVTIMQLSPEMDAGPIYAQTTHKLSGVETSPELYETLANIGAGMLIKALPGIIDKSIIPTPQDDNRASYCELLKKEDAWLKPGELAALQAECKIRAHLTFPKTKYNLLGKDIVITKAHIVDTIKTPADIICKDKNFLSIDTLIAPSGRKMSVSDFLNGYNN
ncbi:methionyl-tRNA formyltransferase [Candidatus Saccharibacteria bacterium HGW-Saccharibacteria-1]|nr:MAG: methionyl-tRNA formyltransferase [Candidatus Saccharibacteria bacterium HGW-Saccharibacteria-1]